MYSINITCRSLLKILKPYCSAAAVMFNCNINWVYTLWNDTFINFFTLKKWYSFVELHTSVLISALPVSSYGKRTLSIKCTTPLEHSISLVMIFALSLMYTTPWDTKADGSDQGEKWTFPLRGIDLQRHFSLL